MKQETIAGLPFDRETPALTLVTRAFAQDRSLHSLLTLYCVLRDFARTDLHVPSNDRLSKACALSLNTVKRGLRVLERFGLMVKRNRGSQRVVHVPGSVAKDVSEALRSIENGDMEINMATGLVTHKTCGQPLDAESFERSTHRPFTGSKGLPIDLSLERNSSKAAQVSLFNSTTSGEKVGCSPVKNELKGGCSVICFCFYNMLIQDREITGIINPEIVPVNKGGRPEENITPEIVEVFEFWRMVCKYPTAKLTKKMVSAIRSRLRIFSVDELKAVATHGATDPWLSGTALNSTKAYNLTETLYRSDDRTAKYLLESKSSKVAAKDTRAVALSATRPVTSVETF